MEDKFTWSQAVHDWFKFEWSPREVFDLSLDDAGLCSARRWQLEDEKESEVILEENEQTPVIASIEEKREL